MAFHPLRPAIRNGVLTEARSFVFPADQIEIETRAGPRSIRRCAGLCSTFKTFLNSSDWQS
jgi:hypothetical protein